MTRRTCSATDGGGAHDAGAGAMRADDGRAFEHAGADALARHFQQAEVRDAADLDAGAVVLQRVLEAALDGAVVPVLLHVDEVDDDEAGEIAQAQLAGDLVGRLAGSSAARCPRCCARGSTRPEFTSIATSASVWLMTM